MKSASRISNGKSFKTASVMWLNARASRSYLMWGGCIGRRKLVQAAGGAHVLTSLAGWPRPKGRFSTTLGWEPEVEVALA